MKTMFIDVHLHTVRVLGLPRNEHGDNYALPEELIAMMDRTGVHVGILLPGIFPEARKQYSTNEDILEIARKFPDRFIAFCSVDPRNESNSVDADLSRIINYYKSQGCKGVGEITANMPLDDPMMFNLFRHCQACDMPILLHLSGKQYGCYGLIDEIYLPRLEKALRTFPDLTIIGHSPAFWSEIDGVVNEETRDGYPQGRIQPGGTIPRLLDKYPNLYCDISAGSGYNALTRDPEFANDFIERYQDRLLFGTDIASPKNDHRHAELLRTKLTAAEMTRQAFEKVSWQNTNRILKLGFDENGKRS